MKKIPRKLQRVLWSYNINKMDAKKSKRLIITQVLNYGDWDDLKWLYRTYSEKDIKEVVKNPSRGVWFENVLNFWLTMFKIRLPAHIKQRAIFRLEPGFKKRATRQFRRG